MHVEHLARAELLALEGEHLLADGDAAEAQRHAAALAAVEQPLDLGVDLALGLRVPVAGERLDERAARVEVELAHLVLAALVQVDGALVDGRARARQLDGAEQLALLHVDDLDAVRRRRAQRDARGREVLGRAQREAPAPLDERALRGERLAVRAHARPEDLRVGVRVDRPLVRGADQVRQVDLLVLVMQDRRLDGAVEELVGVAAEELVERVLAGDVDGEPAPAAPGAAPHLAQRGDGAGERHADRRVERADVDAELERVGRDDREQLALGQPPLELAALLRRVAGAVGRDAVGELVVAGRARARRRRASRRARRPCATS